MFETEFDKPEWGNSWSDFLKSILAQSLAHSNAEFSSKVYRTSMFGKMEKQTNPKKCFRNSGLIQSYFFGDLTLREEDRNEMPLTYIQSILKRQTLPYWDNRGGRLA